MGTAAVQGEIWDRGPAIGRISTSPLGAPSSKRRCGRPARRREGVSLMSAAVPAGALVIAAEMGAEVAGLDASANLVAIAPRASPRLARSKSARWEAAALLATESFDIVTGINSFQFAGDLVLALKEARRVSEAGRHASDAGLGGREDSCELVAGRRRRFSPSCRRSTDPARRCRLPSPA